MEIRRMNSTDDRWKISRIYEESWRDVYKGIVPESFLRNIPTGHWVPFLDSSGADTLVVIEDDAYVGTASYSRSRFADFKDFGEIISVYMLPQYTGRGYGGQLLEAAVKELKRQGCCDVFLWVLEENLRARRFYEKAGFVLNDKYLEDKIGEKTLREIAYCRYGI